MYTVVPKTEVVEHRPRPGEPSVEIIDHREKKPQSLSTKKKRPEQLPYDSLKTQRDSLFQKELKYKKRIEDLEKDSAELLKTYETTYEENSKLKSILENGPDAVKLKQLSKDKKEQKGLIDQLKDENQLLQEKMVQLEREIQAEKLKANDKSWDEQLKKVKKKRDEEDSIPTEGPFVGGQIAKPKRLVLLDDDGEHKLDAYDLQVESLEKETQVLLNKVKILKREKEQIDYATLMGKGAVTKNKTIGKAINDKLNRDLNKFVIRLQMLKMKQNAARTYCDLMAEESTPDVQLKPSESGQASPDGNNREGRRSGRSWKSSGVPSPKVNTGNMQTKTECRKTPIKNGNISSRRSSGVQIQESVLSRRSSYAKTIENDMRKKSTTNNAKKTEAKKITDTDEKPAYNTGKSVKRGNVRAAISASTKVKSNDHDSISKTQSPSNVEASDDEPSAQIWRRVQSSRQLGRNVETRILPEYENRQVHPNDHKNKREPRSRGITNSSNTMADVISSKAKGDISNYAPNNQPPIAVSENQTKLKIARQSKQEYESVGRYTNGPEPIGRKGLANKKTSKPNNGSVTFEKAPMQTPRLPMDNDLGDSDSTTDLHHGHVYRINGLDDGYSLVRINDHIQRTDRGVRTRPVPINFKTKKSFDVRGNRSIIGNTGIRSDAFYRKINDEDPYYGL